MGAVKNFLAECAEAGCCPLSVEALARLDDLECQRGIDWIDYCEHDYEGRDGVSHSQECVTMETARRLLAEGLACGEIEFFVECFGDFDPSASVPCDSCGDRHRAGDLTLMRHGERFCDDCR